MLELLFRVVFGWFASLCPSGVRFIWVVIEHCKIPLLLNTMTRSVEKKWFLNELQQGLFPVSPTSSQPRPRRQAQISFGSDFLFILP
jgi:hypothetical protein